ncbi:MAG: oligosaccharide flippase family protein [Pirellulales bacterium]
MASSAQPVQSASAGSAVRASSLAEGVLILLGLTVVQRLVGFIRSILFCRWLDADQLGQWDLAFNFLMLAAPLAVFGLPGSFGRYVETYRDSGRLRTFLRRTTWASVVPALMFCLIAAALSPWLAELIFGEREQATLVLVMSGTLAALISFNFLTCFFTALRGADLFVHAVRQHGALRRGESRAHGLLASDGGRRRRGVRRRMFRLGRRFAGVDGSALARTADRRSSARSRRALDAVAAVCVLGLGY